MDCCRKMRRYRYARHGPAGSLFCLSSNIVIGNAEGSGSYYLSKGSLTADQELIGANNGTGTFTRTGGSVGPNKSVPKNLVAGSGEFPA